MTVGFQEVLNEKARAKSPGNNDDTESLISGEYALKALSSILLNS